MRSVKSKKSNKKWYTREIQQIMHACGDCSRPSAETAALIEDILHQQMVSLVLMATRLSLERCSKNNVSIEDFLFLMRKNKTKLSRLLKHLSFKDKKSSILLKSDQEVIQDLIGSNDIPGDSDVNQVASHSESKRIKSCREFLSTIDITGDLIKVLDDDFFDPVKYQRDLKRDRLTEKMSQSHYLRYSEARKANFSDSKSTSNKFNDWLNKDKNLSEIKLKSDVIEILQYLAYETVTEIIDMSLLMKQDRNRNAGEHSSYYSSKKAHNINYPQFALALDNRLKNSIETNNYATDQPNLIMDSDSIQPNDVNEALRRFSQPRGIQSIFKKDFHSSIGLICLQ